MNVTCSKISYLNIKQINLCDSGISCILCTNSDKYKSKTQLKNYTPILPTDFIENLQKVKFGEILPLGGELLYAGEQRGGQTDDEANIRLCYYFAKPARMKK